MPPNTLYSEQRSYSLLRARLVQDGPKYAVVILWACANIAIFLYNYLFFVNTNEYACPRSILGVRAAAAAAEASTAADLAAAPA